MIVFREINYSKAAVPVTDPVVWSRGTDPPPPKKTPEKSDPGVLESKHHLKICLNFRTLCIVARVQTPRTSPLGPLLLTAMVLCKNLPNNLSSYAAELVCNWRKCVMAWKKNKQ